MPDYWLDSSALMSAKNDFYGFDIVPGFWRLLEQKGGEGIVGSCLLVYDELTAIDDELARWARQQKEKGFFLDSGEDVQAAYRRIADWVENNERFASQHVAPFLDGADAWLIAHAQVQGGKIITQENSQPLARKPKIPDVANNFGVLTLTVFDLLRQLGASFN
jgi:hypothetical protein